MGKRSCVSMFVLLVGIVTVVPAAERRISREQLPRAVEQTVQQYLAGAQVLDFTTEMEHGERVYEASLRANGRTRDLQIAASGELREVEEEVPLDELPLAVQTALKRKTRGAHIVKVESLRKRGRLVAYEAATRRGSQTGEVEVGPQGETLSRQE